MTARGAVLLAILLVLAACRFDTQNSVPPHPATNSDTGISEDAVTATPGDGTVTLTWTPNSQVSSYQIYQGGSPEMTVDRATKVASGITSPYTVSGLANDVPVSFLVTATVNGTEGPIGRVVSAIPQRVVPSAPRELLVTPGATEIRLSWPEVPRATSYRVFWQEGSSVTEATGTRVDCAGPSFVHRDVIEGHTYSYLVQANNSAGASASSARVVAKAAASPVGAPSDVAAKTDGTTVTLQWTEEPGATGYRVYWAMTPGLATSGGTAVDVAHPPFIHSGLVEGQPYYYCVSAIRTGVESPRSGEVWALPQGTAPLAPGVPEVVSSEGQNTVSWMPSDRADRYWLYWSLGPTVVRDEAHRLGPVSSPYQHQNLTNGTAYFYTVTAQNSSGESAPSLVGTGTPALEYPMTGAALAYWNGWVYVLGGRDRTGGLRSEVWRAPLGASGALGAWVRDKDLPEPVAEGSAVAAVQLISLIGGRDRNGLRDKVVYNLFNADGSLGFTNGWANSPFTRLPEPRAGAASVVSNGRVFLFGGRTGAGADPAILSARLWPDKGEVGYFTKSSQTLPAGADGWGVGVGRGGFLAVGGGTDQVYFAGANDQGQPSAWTSYAPLGQAVAFPGVQSTEEGWMVAGGLRPDGQGPASTWVSPSGSWAARAPLRAPGPASLLVGDRQVSVAAVRGFDPPLLALGTVSTSRADTPQVFPGSGVILKGASPVVSDTSGDMIRYEVSPPGQPPVEPQGTSPSWDPLHPPTVDADGTWSFRAYRSGGAASETTVMNYRVLAPSGMPIAQSPELTIQDGSTKTTRALLAATISNPTLTAKSRVVIRLSPGLVRPQALSLEWGDSRSNPGTYSAKVMVSVFENTIAYSLTPVLDSTGTPVFRRQDGPVALTLGPGEYEVLVEAVDSTDWGKTFGLALVRK